MKQKESFDYVPEVPEESLGENRVSEDQEKKIELKTFGGSMESLENFFKENENLRQTTHNEVPLKSEQRVAWQAFMDMLPQNGIHPDGHDKTLTATRFGVPEIDVIDKEVIGDQLLYKTQTGQAKKSLHRTSPHTIKDDPFLKEVTPESMSQLTNLLEHDFDIDKGFVSTDERNLENIFKSFSSAHNTDQLVVTTMNMRRTLRFYNELENVNIISVEVASAVHTIKCSLALIVDVMEEMAEFYENLPKEGNDLQDKRDPLIKKFGRRLYLSMSTAETALNALALECEEVKTRISEIESMLVPKNQ